MVPLVLFVFRGCPPRHRRRLSSVSWILSGRGLSPRRRHFSSSSETVRYCRIPKGKGGRGVNYSNPKNSEFK